MESTCFNCGEDGHSYIECRNRDPVDRNFKKQSKLDYRELHPNVNRKSYDKREERKQFYKEGPSIPVKLLLHGLDCQIDFLRGVLDIVQDNKIVVKYKVSALNINRNRYLQGIVEKALPEIRRLTAYAKSHLRENDGKMDYITAGILKGKEHDLRNLRDETITAIKVAMACVDMYDTIVYSPSNSGRPDAKELMNRLNSLSENVRFIHLDEDRIAYLWELYLF